MRAALPDRADIEAAAQRISGRVRRTPVLEIDGHDLGVPGRVVLKLELTQHTGSFKARGALNSVLSLPPGTTGVVAASGGNHGAAIAWASKLAGLVADVFVPATSPAEKVERIRGHGATAHVVEGFYPEALAASRQWAEGRSVATVHAYDQPSTVCGAGTVGLEIASQVPEAGLVLVACGGGGLYAGTALALRGTAQVLPIEPRLCANLARAQAAGHPVPIEVSGVAADSLGAEKVGELAFATAAALQTSPVEVGDDDIISARSWLWQHCRVLAEPGAAAALAALQSGAVRVETGETVVVVVSGGNNPAIP